MGRVVLLFTDGVGVGDRNAQVNPLATQSFLLSQFKDGTGEPLPDGGRLLRLDPTFGVPGRPQSASNQTALLTGEPAPALIGRHVLGFPDAALRALLAEKSIVKQLVEHGRTVTFANGYPASYLDLLGLRRRLGSRLDVPIPTNAKRRLKPSATTLAMAAGDIELRTLDDVAQGEALTHDIDSGRGRGRGLALPETDTTQAAEVFWNLAKGFDFTLFEHFLADEAGHAQDAEAAVKALGTFDAFLRAVLKARPDDAHVLVCSDHGNVEDLSIRQHTLNEVPLLWFGPANEQRFLPKNVAEVGLLILSLLGVPLST
jgi:hypothetical protein